MGEENLKEDERDLLKVAEALGVLIDAVTDVFCDCWDYMKELADLAYAEINEPEPERHDGARPVRQQRLIPAKNKLMLYGQGVDYYGAPATEEKMSYLIIAALALLAIAWLLDIPSFDNTGHINECIGCPWDPTEGEHCKGCRYNPEYWEYNPIAGPVYKGPSRRELRKIRRSLK